jgi:purine-binding chemotaxis protein CheW
MSTTCSSGELQVTTFRLGDRLLGIDIAAIREINRVGEMTPVPDAPAAVRGVINLRGDVVTVLDLRVMLDLDPAPLTLQSRWIILDAGTERVGLLVDRVEDVTTVALQDAEGLPPTASPTEQRHFQAVYQLDQDLLVLLDVTHLVDVPSRAA